MSQISISKTYSDGDVLLELDLDNIREGTETFLNTTKLNDDNIQNQGINGSKIIDGTIVDDNLTTATLTTGLFVDDDLDDTKIAPSTTISSNYATDSIDSDELAATSVDTSDIAAINVTTAKIGDGEVATTHNSAATVEDSGAVTQLASNPRALVASVDITTTANRPIMVGMMSQSPTTADYMGVTEVSATLDGGVVDIQIDRDSTVIAYVRCWMTGGLDATSTTFLIPSSCISIVDIPGAAGTYTYDIYVIGTGSSSVSVNLRGTWTAFEL